MHRHVRWLLVPLLVVLAGQPIRVGTQASTPPILLITNSAAPNPFGPYLAEILRAEGLNQFATKDLAAVAASDLSTPQLVVLAETPLTATQSNLFSNYVAGGGRLVAMHPDDQLAPVLGLSPAGSATTEGYFAINSATAFSDGFPSVTLPFHGQANNYVAASGSTVLATLYSDAVSPTAFPAVIKSGRTATWAYDVARSVVLTRQGNPANASDRDGQPPFRTEDIFYNAIDRDKVDIPYADVQMRMLGRVIADLLADVMPIPRLWYFPGAKRTVMVVTADSHANPQSYFDAVASSVEARGGRVSFYIYHGSDQSPAQVATWRARGHEVGMHPAGFQYSRSLTAAFQAAEDYFSSIGDGLPSATTRTHQVEWQGWVDAAKIEASFGIQLDTSFYTWGPAVTYSDGHQAHGYINGSGLPMRFIDQAGAIVPVYQQVTSLIDEQLVVGSFSEQLPTDQALVVTRKLIDNSQAGGYSAITTQFHVDYFGFAEVGPWADGTMDYAQSLGIPIWTAERWLNYTTARTATTLTGFSWDAAAKQLAFTVGVPANAEAQSVTLPGAYNNFSVSGVSVDGTPTSVVTQAIAGRDARFLNIGPGTHSVVVTYGTAIPPPEHAPVAGADAANVTEGQTVVIPVLANDSDADGDVLTVVSTSSDPGAVITINSNQTVSYTPNPGTCGLDTFSYTISDGRGGTASANVSVSVTCESGQVTHQTVADFGAACAVRSSTIVTHVGDGEVRLGGTQGDEYTQAALDASKWIAGTWSGGAYTPALSGGILSIADANGAYVRSVAASPLTTVDASVRFSGLPWEHVGWADLNFTGGYAIFSTYNTSTTLFARTSADGASEQQTNLGPIPAGFHNFRIDRQIVSASSNRVSYYVDGVLRAQHTVGSLPQMYVYQSHNGGTAQTLDIDRIDVYPAYTGSGSYQSCTIDIGNTSSAWSTAEWQLTSPAGTTFQLRTRTSSDGTAWSGWSAPLTTTGETISSPAGRFLQYLAEFATSDPSQSPVLDSVTMRYNSTSGALPTVSINDVSVTEGNSSNVAATFTVTLSAASSQTVTINYATADGTATAGSDYMAASGTLTFAPGATSQTLTVTTLGDTAVEPNETFFVNLSSPSNATVADSQGLATIVDNDLPTMSINSVSVTEGNSGTVNATFAVTLSQSTTQTVTVNYATANGTASSGSDYVATSGTLTFQPGATSASVTVVVNGDTLNEANETFSVNLSGPTNATIATAQGTGTIVNDDFSLPTLAINDVSVPEGDTGNVTATFTVSLSTASGQSVTVNYATANGTATSGTDYTAASGTLTFAAGVTAQSINVTVNGDTTLEPNETFFVNLSNAGNATIADAQGTGTILNNDPPALAINGVSVTEGNSGTVNATFTVTLSQPTTQTVTVNYATANGTATSGSDYVAKSGTLTFPAGNTNASVTVVVNGDTLSEANETFSVNLSGATNATIATAQGIGTIVNDDVASPTLAINDVTVTEGDSGTSTATFTVSLSAASDQSVTVNYGTADGTATSGGDYTAASGSLTFAPGATTRTFDVLIVGDAVPEGRETFVANLSSPIGATLSRAQGTATIVDNDGTMTVTTPNTAVTWLVGTSQTIAWTNNLGSSATVRVELSRDSGTTWSVLAASVQNSSPSGGTFNWTVTSPATTSARIRAIWTTDSSVNDVSDVNFTIASSTITVTSPNGGETWRAGATATVNWSSNLPASDNVRIELSTDGGNSYSVALASSTPNNGAASFTVQSAWKTPRARIRVTWLTNNSVNDVSNANFRIQ